MYFIYNAIFPTESALYSEDEDIQQEQSTAANLMSETSPSALRTFLHVLHISLLMCYCIYPAI